MSGAFSFVFRDRDQSHILMPRLRYRPLSYSWSALGGPKRATVEAVGPVESLFRLVEHLRAPATIYNGRNLPVWWGYISEVQIYRQGVRYGVSLDNMTNKVAVAYTELDERQTTAWSTDATSVAEYGTKELLLSRSEITTADALQYRDTQLAARKYPVPVIQFGSRLREGEGRAIIQCASWLDTLDWRHYTNAVGKESCETLDDGRREIGEDDRPILAQSFQVSSAVGWDANAIWIRPWKYPPDNLPTDNVVVGLYSDSGNEPNALLASGSVAGASIPLYSEWTEFTLNVAVSLATGTTYWIRVSRSGAVDPDKYFMVDFSKTGTYQNGEMKLYNTNLSAWVTEPKFTGDLNFKVVGDLATTTQISDMITSVGEFFSGTDIVNASGVDTNPYRNGDTTALFELLQLLATGTTNDRRLLCTVTEGRRLRIYEEPAKPGVGEDAYAIDGMGRLYTPYGRRVEPSECKVAVWSRLKDVIPGSVDLSKISDPSLLFVEEAEYDVEKNEYRILRAKDQLSIFDFTGLQEG